MINIVEQRKTDHFYALETFGGRGRMLTFDLYRMVDKMDIWEINNEYEKDLKRRFPCANIKICDSIEEIKNVEDNTYNLVSMDNPPYLEPFSMYPEAFRILKNIGIIITNSISSKKINKQTITDEQIAKRYNFYKSDNVDVGHIVKTFINLAHESGYEVNWVLVNPNSIVDTLAMKVTEYE